MCNLFSSRVVVLYNLLSFIILSVILVFFYSKMIKEIKIRPVFTFNLNGNKCVEHFPRFRLAFFNIFISFKKKRAAKNIMLHVTKNLRVMVTQPGKFKQLKMCSIREAKYFSVNMYILNRYT